MPSSDPYAERPPPFVRAAFYQVHATRLHGFALLLSLGDGARAAFSSAEALNAGAQRIEALRHPERAAAWLRSRLLRAAPRGDGNGQPFAVRIEGLKPLGVQPAALTGLAALTARERAALIADEIERLDRRDVEAILRTSPSSAERLIRGARRRYADAYGRALFASPTDAGPLPIRVMDAGPSDVPLGDPHEAFSEWIASGARDEMAPALTRHAIGCRICLRSAAAIDALRVIDLGLAPAPTMPTSFVPEKPVISMGALRAAVGSSAAVLLAAVLATNIGGLMSTSSNGFVPPATETPREAVLGVGEVPTQAPLAVVAPSAGGSASASIGTATAVPAETLLAAPLTPIDAPVVPTASPSPSNAAVPTAAPGATALPEPTASLFSAAPSSPPTQPPTPTPTPAPTNSAPVAVADSYPAVAGVATVFAPGVLGNDTDPDGDPLTAVVVTDPVSGTLVFSADGSFTYTAAPLDPSESVTFVYRASDGVAESLDTTVTITLGAAEPEVATDVADPR
ncbi:MAG: Ig-like domain-containing protein [Candidatus Limnocylindria bacterium]